jgi:hypothetical protein
LRRKRDVITAYFLSVEGGHQMRFLNSSKYFAAIACFTWATAVVGAKAAPTSFTVQLAGSQVVPAVTSSGTGVANLTYDPASRLLTWSITYTGLSSPVTMAHFHGPAAPGKNSGPVIPISHGGAVKSPMKGKATLTPAQAKELAAGDWYINLHTKGHPDGEVRGQVMLPKGS